MVVQFFDMNKETKKSNVISVSVNPFLMYLIASSKLMRGHSSQVCSATRR